MPMKVGLFIPLYIDAFAMSSVRRPSLLASSLVSPACHWVHQWHWKITMKLLMVLTSHDKPGNTGRNTGFRLEEFAAPYYTFPGRNRSARTPSLGRPSVPTLDV
jgi:hypothetical protein